MRRPLVACALVFVSCISAQASPILTWEISGHTTSENLLLFPALPLATPLSFVVEVDLATPDTCEPPTSGQYFFPNSTMTYEGNTYTRDAHLEVNSPAGSCFGGLGDLTLRVAPDAGGGPLFWAVFPSATTPGVADIPLAPSFEGSFWISRSPVFGPAITGNVDSFVVNPVVIPEPTSLVLFASGTAGLLLRRRRRKPSGG